VVIDDFLPEDIHLGARRFLLKELRLDSFRQAGIGALEDFKIRDSIRNDRIYWLERKRDVELEGFFSLVDETIRYLNQLCFLSISGSEFHLAHYPPGSFYKKHVDQFNQRSNRLISMICYLNESWEESHGGMLRVFQDDGKFMNIAPKPRRMVLFKSDKVPHEVLKTTVSRYSITGWLLHQPTGVGYLLG